MDYKNFNLESGGTLRGSLNPIEMIRGYSAFEVAVINGFSGTEEEWLESLKGESGYQIAVQYGYTGTEAEFVEDLTNFATLAEETKNAEANASESAVSAANDAAVAQSAKTAAQSALAGVQTAIKNIPAGATPIVNDLTTGGVSMALSAEMGKVLLPLDGSKSMTGNLVIERAYPFIAVKDTTAARWVRIAEYPNSQGGIENYKDSSNYRGIRINTEADDLTGALKLAQKLGDKWSEYPILHTGNKPSGSYKGTGDAAERTVDTGGIGHTVMIYTSVSIALVTNSGTLCCNLSTGEVTAHNRAKFRNGVLTISTAGDFVNFSGNTYNYQVL